MNMIASQSSLHPALVQPPGIARLTVDFESFYDRELSLSKMTVVEYLHHPRFEEIGASVRWDTHPVGAKSDAMTRPFSRRAKWVEAPGLRALFRSYDWRRIILVSHNILFDGAMMAWLYGHAPVLYMDSLGYARALVYPYTGKASLEAVADYLHLPPKQKTVIVNALGWRLADFRADEARGGTRYAAYREYCEHDSDLCAGIIDRLAPQMPSDEIIMCDIVARMAIQPQFQLDVDVLKNHLKRVVDVKDKLLAKIDDIGADKETLMSNEKLAAMLRFLGVEPPMKFSVKKQAMDYAFAKTDKAFTDLQEDEDELVQAVVSARLGVKSTIEETRTMRFLACADVKWHPVCDDAMLPAAKCLPHRMPFPLKFSGAHTHRLSGEWKLNLQNLSRYKKELRRGGELRKGLKAPKGYVVVSADASQIEARVVCELAGAKKVLHDFRTNNDPYMRLGEVVYDAAPNTMNKVDHPLERFVGKTGVLGLGFGVGPPKFVTTCWNQGRVVISDEIAQKAVKSYRRDYAPEVPSYWKTCDTMIDVMVRGDTMVHGPITVMGKRILLPNGMWLHYPNMHYEQRPSPWKREEVVNQAIFNFGKEVCFTWGGALTENIVQALARIITMGAALRIRKKYGIARSLAGQVHDQLVYILPENEGRDFLDQVLLPEMRIAPEWLPNLPLDAEGGVGPNLFDAK